jgi:hypothetical protein
MKTEQNGRFTIPLSMETRSLVLAGLDLVEMFLNTGSPPDDVVRIRFAVEQL